MLVPGDSTIASINDMYVDDMVTDDDHQIVSGNKRFTESIFVDGNIDVDLLNGVNVSQAYGDAFLNGEDVVEVFGNLTFAEPVAIDADVNTTRMNGVEISYVDKILRRDINEAWDSKITNRLIGEIEENVGILSAAYASKGNVPR